ncbi:MAG TPA: glycosyl hydrolase family 65 protein [Bacillota bacterium]|nr:glycosyl hydrolase family 65 protein [Bacillota bacterium]
MAVVLGFGGLNFDCDDQGELIILEPALPRQWNSLRFQIQIRNQTFQVEISHHQVRLKAGHENTRKVRFNVTGRTVNCETGQELTMDYQGIKDSFKTEAC